MSTTQQLDRRLHAYRPDLADDRLRGQVEAASFVVAHTAHVVLPVCDVRSRPSREAGVTTQFLRNAQVAVFENRGGWAWVQAQADGYVGYVPSAAIAVGAPQPATHRVSAARTFVYSEPDLKTPATTALSMGTHLAVTDTVEARGTQYGVLADGGYVVASHLRRVTDHADDYVSVAEALIHTPYLWGGSSAFGVDCSGLVQLAMAMCGSSQSRDSDMQFESTGTPIDAEAGLQRGDLIFWNGHVAIVRDSDTIIHANGHSMTVAIEDRVEAIERIAYLYENPIGFKRP
ncbi:MAG: NlpC/P60 family protein [Pseudomonadota bacterium]